MLLTVFFSLLNFLQCDVNTANTLCHLTASNAHLILQNMSMTRNLLCAPVLGASCVFIKCSRFCHGNCNAIVCVNLNAEISDTCFVFNIICRCMLYAIVYGRYMVGNNWHRIIFYIDQSRSQNSRRLHAFRTQTIVSIDNRHRKCTRLSGM